MRADLMRAVDLMRAGLSVAGLSGADPREIQLIKCKSLFEAKMDKKVLDFIQKKAPDLLLPPPYFDKLNYVICGLSFSCKGVVKEGETSG